ncbi:MAG: hypothetical protein ACWGOV_10230 [Acidiferrobacterales bacterium]
MRLGQTIAVLGLSLVVEVCWANSLEQNLGLTDDVRSASELVSLCKSTDPDKSAYCKGYMEGATHLWKVQKACASAIRRDQSFCAGAKAANELVSKTLHACKDCNLGNFRPDLKNDPRRTKLFIERMQRFADELKTTLGVCLPEKGHDRNYCLGYNMQAAITVADMSMTYHSSASESARELGMGRAESDVFINAYASAEFLALRPCIPVAMTPEKVRKIMLAFVRENPDQQVNLPAVMLLARALFYDFCPGPTSRQLKPHLENCLTWTQVSGKGGVRNSCSRPVVIEFVYKGKLEHRVIPGNAFSADPSLSTQPSPFTVCPVGYVSSVPFTAENREDIRLSKYSCVRK